MLVSKAVLGKLARDSWFLLHGDMVGLCNSEKQEFLYETAKKKVCGLS